MSATTNGAARHKANEMPVIRYMKKAWTMGNKISPASIRKLVGLPHREQQ
jgi:hypothetical protein